MPRAKAKTTIEEIDATIEAIRAKAEKEIAALEQRKTHVQASHFQRITRVARAAGCDLAQVSDADLIAALKALNATFQGQATGTAGAAQRTNESGEAETTHGQRRSAKG
ncbi:MAG: hypothetical protein AB7O44_31755 [Hyphomicrobiaceae bacterium]